MAKCEFVLVAMEKSTAFAPYFKIEITDENVTLSCILPCIFLVHLMHYISLYCQAVELLHFTCILSFVTEEHEFQEHGKQNLIKDFFHSYDI